MKVQSNPSKKITQNDAKLSKDQIQAKIQAKFGKKSKPKQIKKVEDKVDLNAKKSESNEKVIPGDIQNNDPKSSITQDKLKHILKKGGFEFSERERKTLAKILK